LEKDDNERATVLVAISVSIRVGDFYEVTKTRNGVAPPPWRIKNGTTRDLQKKKNAKSESGYADLEPESRSEKHILISLLSSASKTQRSLRKRRIIPYWSSGKGETIERGEKNQKRGQAGSILNRSSMDDKRPP